VVPEQRKGGLVPQGKNQGVNFFSATRVTDLRKGGKRRGTGQERLQYLTQIFWVAGEGGGGRIVMTD